MSAKSIFLLSTGAVGAIGGALTQVFGNFDYGLQTLIILIAIDYLTGILCALVFKNSKNHENGAYDSKSGIKNLVRKGCILLVVIVGYRLDLIADTNSMIRNSVIIFFIANEGLSIIENFGLMGIPLPKSITKAFDLLRSKEDSDDLAGEVANTFVSKIAAKATTTQAETNTTVQESESNSQNESDG